MPIGMQPSLPGRVERLMINLDTMLPLSCAWDDCDRKARTPYQVKVHEHPGHWKCSYVDEGGGAFGRHAHFVFCSDTCLDYWVASSGRYAHHTAARNQGRIYGMRSAGAPRRYR